MSVAVDILKVHPDAVIPEYKTAGACGFDLTIIEDRTIGPGEIVRLRTGLVICVPKGYVLFLSSRSSTPVKFGLNVPHGYGLIDNDFCGPNDELVLQVRNFTDKPVEVHKGDRLLQGIFLPFEKAAFNHVASLSGETRGGFGTTG